MEQRLRLVQGGHQPRSEKRTAERRVCEQPVDAESHADASNRSANASA